MGIKMFVEMFGFQILEAYPKEIIMDEYSNLHAKMIQNDTRYIKTKTKHVYMFSCSRVL